MKGIRQLTNLCGIDVGCTNIKMTAISEDGCVEKTIPSGDDFTRDELVSAITEFFDPLEFECRGLGIALSGSTTLDGQSVYRTTLKCLEGLSVSDFKHLACNNVRLINDSNATALAGLLEYPESKVLLGVTNGTGIGLGIVINGQLFTGSNGFAGEIYGNPTIGFDGQLTKTGRICSGSKIMKRIYEGDEAQSKWSEAIKGANYMGMELVSLIHSFNPDVVYLSGGGFCLPGYFGTVHDFVLKHVYPQFAVGLNFEMSKFSTYSGCYGAMKYLLYS